MDFTDEETREYFRNAIGKKNDLDLTHDTKGTVLSGNLVLAREQQASRYLLYHL